MSRIAAMLTALASLLLAASAIALYTRAEIADSRAFAARGAAALEDGRVRTAFAEQIVGALSERLATDALVARPLAVAAVAALAGAAPVRRAVAVALERRHATLLAGSRPVRLSLVPDDPLLASLLDAVSRRTVRRLPVDISVPFAVFRPHDFELTAARAARRASAWSWWLAGAALIALAACAALAGSLRAAVFAVGAAVAGAGLIVASLVTVAGWWLAALTGVDERALGAVWSALLGDLRSTGATAALGGIVVAALAGGGPAFRRAGARIAALRAAWPRHPAARRLAFSALFALGIALVLAPGTALRTLTIAAGGVLALVALTRLAGELNGDQGVTSSGRLLAAVGGAVAATVVVAALLLPAPSMPESDARERACQGARATCDLRLDEAMFPATHNSYAAANEGGWYFANQRHGIVRQLRDGIRAFLIDIHFGVQDPASGRIRTDLVHEGSSRNKVVQALSPAAVRLAESLAGRIGRPLPAGERRLFLCHTLCELGAEPLGQQLQLFRAFLASDPDDVVVLVIEPYVPPEPIERAFAAAGLDRMPVLDPGGPLPTLGDLVAQDRRLVVLAEEEGGMPPWYHDAFSFVQDTPLGAESPGELRCERFRGGTESPLLMLNHWIPPFPPSVRANARIGGAALRERIERCERERGRAVNVVAVDFYERSEAVEIAQETMARRAAEARP